MEAQKSLTKLKHALITMLFDYLDSQRNTSLAWKYANETFRFLDTHSEWWKDIHLFYRPTGKPREIIHPLNTKMAEAICIQHAEGAILICDVTVSLEPNSPNEEEDNGRLFFTLDICEKDSA